MAAFRPMLAATLEFQDLGAIEVIYNAKKFFVGTGFDDAQREEIWKNKNSYLGAVIKIKFFEYGEYGLPRFPVFLGFRDDDDI